MSDWANRTGAGGRGPGAGVSKARKAQLAAAALLLAQLVMQLLNFLRADLAPVKQKLEEMAQQMTRIEQRLEDHERRIKRLEDGESSMGDPQRPAVVRKNSRR